MTRIKLKETLAHKHQSYKLFAFFSLFLFWFSGTTILNNQSRSSFQFSNQRATSSSAALLPCWDWLPPADSDQWLGGRRSQTQRQLWVQSNSLFKKNPFSHLCNRSLYYLGWLKVFAMKRGVVGIKGVKTNLYLCLSADGMAYGSVRASTKLKSRVKMLLNSFVFFKHID